MPAIGLVQMRCSETPEENLERAVAGIREAARQGAAVVCTQELFRSRYFCQQEDPARFALAEPIPGPTTERLTKVAAEAGVTLVASLFEQRAAGLYHNTAVVIDGGEPFTRIAVLQSRFQRTNYPTKPLRIRTGRLRQLDRLTGQCLGVVERFRALFDKRREVI